MLITSCDLDYSAPFCNHLRHTSERVSELMHTGVCTCVPGVFTVTFAHVASLWCVYATLAEKPECIHGHLLLLYRMLLKNLVFVLLE